MAFLHNFLFLDSMEFVLTCCEDLPNSFLLLIKRTKLALVLNRFFFGPVVEMLISGTGLNPVVVNQFKGSSAT